MILGYGFAHMQAPSGFTETGCICKLKASVMLDRAVLGRHYVSQWLECLPDNRLTWVQKTVIARVYLYQYPFKEELLREMRIIFAGVVEPSIPQRFSQKQKPFPRLQEVTDLYV